MKRPSEGQFGAALRDVDVAMIVYKPPDDARNRKPCDFMAWHHNYDFPRSTWFEVKDVDTVDAFPFSELRPSQLQGIRDAERIGIPYWLAVYWRRHRAWTISDAVRVLGWRDDIPALEVRNQTSIPRELLMSRFGIDATPATLTSVLKSVLLGDV